jgi:hypothetical protein
MKYYANVSPRGAIRRDQALGSIGVLESPINCHPIGVADTVGWTDDGTVFWKLIIGGTELPGRWFIRDREFHPEPLSRPVRTAQESGQAPGRG